MTQRLRLNYVPMPYRQKLRNIKQEEYYNKFNRFLKGERHTQKKTVT